MSEDWVGISMKTTLSVTSGGVQKHLDLEAEERG